MDIDLLCESLSSGSLCDLSSTEEYEYLSYSQSLDLVTLRNEKWLKNSIARYKRYLEYTGISDSKDQDLIIIRLLIIDFLSFKNWENDVDSEIMTQAAKCMTIDMLILKYINIDDDDSIAESIDSF